MVKQWMGQDIKAGTRDVEDGRTPLSWVVEKGHEGVVRLLVRGKEVDPNISSKSGKTPFSLATENDHDRVVKLLHSRRC